MSIGFARRSSSHRKFVVRAIALMVLAGGVFTAQTTTSSGQSLYLLAATPSGYATWTPYEAELYSCDNGKPYSLVRKIATSKDGILFIIPDYDTGIIALGKPFPRMQSLELISMQNPGQSIVRAIDFRSVPLTAWINIPVPPQAQHHKEGFRTLLKPAPDQPPSIMQKMLVRRGNAAWLALGLLGDNGRNDVDPSLEIGIPLTPTSSNTLEVLSAADFANIRSHGLFGLHGLGDGDMPLIYSEEGHWVMRTAVGAKAVNLPPQSNLPSSRVYWRLMAQTQDSTIIQADVSYRNHAATMQAAAEGRVRIYRPKSGKWENLAVPAAYPRIKIINNWIMGIVREDANGRISPGQQNRRPIWRSKTSPPRPDTSDVMRSPNSYYPGLLFLINTDTGRYTMLKTDEGDSEILLVDGTTVYYRVNDRILKANIQGDSIGPATELARADELRDVHWAFFSR